MKKFYLLLLACWAWSTGAVYAQTPNAPLLRNESPPTPDSLRLKLSSVFGHLDPWRLPTYYLAEYATPLVSLQRFNGTLTDSSLTDPTAFRMLYATMLSARLADPAGQYISLLPTLEEVDSRTATAQAAAPASLPVLLQRMHYTTLRSDALTSNLLRVQNDELYDVPNRPSPYQGDWITGPVVFAAAPARDYSETGDVSLVFPRSLYLENISFNPTTTIQVDFGDGRGYLPVSWDQPIGTTYGSAGTKRIKVRLVSYWGSTVYENLESHFDLEVRPEAPAARYDTPRRDVRIASTGEHSGGRIQLRYGGNHTRLTKPLIVVEGYDISSIAPALQGNVTIADFLNSIAVNFTGGGDFRNALDSIGEYDIVFIDYANGTDDIRRNAALFREVVRWVNDNKVGSEQNVVLGESMGGLVARYGLAQMVKRGEDPQTRLLITHDSPHRGANAPLGIQALTRQADFPLALSLLPVNGSHIISTTALSPELAQAVKVLDAKATEQLSILRATDGEGGLATNTFLDGEYRSMITFAPGGPAPNYRFIATSQGSQCGVSPVAPYTELVRGQSRGALKADLNANALPAYPNSNRIAYLRVWVEFPILRVIKIKFNIQRVSYASLPNTIAWDSAPGGTANLGQQGITLPDFLNPVVYNGDLCFVPTASALDIADITPATVAARYIGGISPLSPSRAEKFITQEADNSGGMTRFNQTHIRFTARNSEWLFREMQGEPSEGVLCRVSGECSPADNVKITGPAGVCGSATYSLPLNGNSLTYSWTASPANLFSVSSGTGPTFTTSNTGNGTGTISVTVTGGCSFTFQRPVSVGAPTELYIDGPEEINECDFIGEYTIRSYDPSLRYSFTTSGPISAKPIRAGGVLQIIPRRPGLGYVTVTAQNDCGSTVQDISIRVNPCYYQYAVYPNPAQQEVTISVKSDAARSAGANTAPTATIPDFEATLYNGQGQAMRQGHGKGGQLRLNLRGLRPGLYQLRTGKGGKWENHQLQITE